jgi:hypothetical protein
MIALESLEERAMLSNFGGISSDLTRDVRPAAQVSDHAKLKPVGEVQHDSNGGRHHLAGSSPALVRKHGSASVANPAAVGSWTPPVNFKPPGTRQPYVAIHMTLLPNGLVLAWPHDYNYFLKTKHAAPYTPGIMLWNPATNQYTALPNVKSNIFCSGSTFLPNGDLMILGGHGPAAIPVSGLQTHYGNRFAEIYNYQTGVWSRA